MRTGTSHRGRGAQCHVTELECGALFSCGTASGKLIRICGTQDQSHVDTWSGIQYRFGPETRPPELVYPGEASNSGSTAKGSFLFFSHEEKKGDYRVTVRFTNGAYTYRVYSGTHSGAGVDVDNAAGKVLSDVRCNEAPYMFIDHMRTNLPCDPKNPTGPRVMKSLQRAVMRDRLGVPDLREQRARSSTQSAASSKAARGLRTRALS
jgi:hypothetical protein